MPLIKLLLSPRLCLLLAFILPCALSAQTRTWTDTQGRSFEGLLLGYDDEFARIERTSDKRQFKLPRENLSEADNAFLDQLQRQERLETFLKDTPKTFDDAYDLSVDDDTPVFIFYRNGAVLSEFDARVEKFLTDPDFQAFIKDKAKIAVIRQKDDNFEAIAQTYVNTTDRPCMLVIKGFRNYSLRGFIDMPMEKFHEHVQDMYKTYDESIH